MYFSIILFFYFLTVGLFTYISPAAKGGDPKFSDIVFFSADYLSPWSKYLYLGWCGGVTFEQF